MRRSGPRRRPREERRLSACWHHLPRWLCLLTLAACGSGEPAPSPPERPNVLWVVWDTVRAQNTSLYGYERPTTPHLEAWARGGRVFEDAISAASITTSAHASMFTGLLPFEHAVGNGHSKLAASHRTVAERLAEVGYRTYLFSANPYLGPETGLDQGFQASERPGQPRFERAFAKLRRARIRDYVRAGHPPGAFRLVAAAGPLAQEGLLAWLARSDANAPFFAVLNYMEAHLPLTPPRRLRERFMTPQQVARSYASPLQGLPVWTYTTGASDLSDADVEVARRTYDAAVAELDELFHALLEELDGRGYLDDTLIVLTADHGELLGEHHMWNHQYALYEELLRVPLVLHDPRRVAPGRDPRPVTNLDLFRTVLEIAGCEVSGPEARGASLLAPPESRVRLSEYLYPARTFLELVEREHPGFNAAPFDRSLRALRFGRSKYIWASDGRHELYDLGRDPRERRDLAHAAPTEAARLDGELRRLLAAGAAPDGPGEAARFDAQTRDMLEALGYAADEKGR